MIVRVLSCQGVSSMLILILPSKRHATLLVFSPIPACSCLDWNPNQDEIGSIYSIGAKQKCKLSKLSRS